MPKNQPAFTLIEILLAVAIIAILAGIIVIAINPAKQIADANNAERQSNVNTIVNAVHQYGLDHGGIWPNTIPVSDNCASILSHEICKTATDCTGLVDLSVLTEDSFYLPLIPTDPTGSSLNGTGYHIAKNSQNRLTVCAPYAENGKTVAITR